jgi:hypothetical protein
MPRARFDGPNLSLTKPVPIRVLSVPVWCRSFEENRTRLQLNPSTQILSFLDSSEQLRLRAATPPIYQPVRKFRKIPLLLQIAVHQPGPGIIWLDGMAVAQSNPSELTESQGT